MSKVSTISFDISAEQEGGERRNKGRKEARYVPLSLILRGFVRQMSNTLKTFGEERKKKKGGKGGGGEYSYFLGIGFLLSPLCRSRREEWREKRERKKRGREKEAPPT